MILVVFCGKTCKCILIDTLLLKVYPNRHIRAKKGLFLSIFVQPLNWADSRQTGKVCALFAGLLFIYTFVQQSRPPASHPPATATILAPAPRAHAAQPQLPSHDQAIIINDDDSGMDLLGGAAQSAQTAHDDSDDNFGVYMLPVRSNNAITPVHNSRRLDAPLPVQQLAKTNSRGATKTSRSRPRASKSSLPRSRERGYRAAVSARAADHLNV